MRFKPLTDRIFSRGVLRAASHAAVYTAWVTVFRLLVVTLITYVLMSSNSRFQEISEAFGSNEVVIVGIGGLCYVLLLMALHPLTSTAPDEVFTPARFERKFIPGFFQGAVLAVGVTLAFMLSGAYHYLGFFIQVEDTPLALGNVVLRIVSIGALVYCEEFLFRQKILSALRREMPELAAAIVTAIVYCGIKILQFDLGIMHVITLFLVSVSLAVKAVGEGDFVRGAGFWAAFLIVFHPMLGLPVLGNEFQGIILVKYQAASESESAASRFLTGGAGGPLSSFALQLLLLFDIAQGVLRGKKILLNRRAPAAKMRA